MQNSRLIKLLGISYPIVQGPMTWLTSAKFVAAVSNAGGLGVLGPNAGQKTIIQDPLKAAERLRVEIRKTSGLTDKPFAVNYILPEKDRNNSFAEQILRVICEEKVRIVVTVAYNDGDGEEQIKKFKAAGIIVIHRNTSPTVKNSLLATQLGVDALVITGHEAGGYLSKHRISTLALLPQITQTVKLPVIAAGGIYNGKGAKAAFAMGAEGIHMGTRFINTYENPASEACKNEIIQINSEDLVEINNIRIGSKQAHKHDVINGIKVGMLDGDINNGYICVSESVGGINNIISCQQVIAEVVADFY